QGRLFFGSFLLTKQKKGTAPPGAHPGQPHENPQPKPKKIAASACQASPKAQSNPKTLKLRTGRQR
ncbi:hypothetical protein, partial [Alicycliphilus denitrificans]|uniref:hypothetical protein n=1 Tax=Alicycliphilus denitrificans TaxID=179636 RepID=UPI001C7DEC95